MTLKHGLCLFLAFYTPSLLAQDIVSGTIFDATDNRFHELIPPDAQLEILADGFAWTEGPVWVPGENHLLFADIPSNTVYQWSDEEGLGIFMRPAGYNGATPHGAELGVNGMILNPNGHLLMCDHGNRAVSILNPTNFTRTPLVSHYNGKRLNSPNDLILKSNGDLYFTDPPYGLSGLNRSPHKELTFNGVYRVTPGGQLQLLTDTISFPNGIAFSPDEKTLYVAISDPQRPAWLAYDVQVDGSIANERTFYDGMAWRETGRHGLPDGMVVDHAGNLFATGPGGVVVLSPGGEHLGTILTGQATANCTFGDDGSTLYITADMYLMRIRTNTTGLGF